MKHCKQWLVKNQEALSKNINPIMTSSDDASIVELHLNDANKFICKYEHLGNIGLGVWHFGLFIDEILVSVVSYGTTCFSTRRTWIGQIAQNYNAKILQLCRGASNPYAPKWSGSKLISSSLKLLSSQNGGPVIVVAYADTNCGEIGTVYQACSAIYTGLTNPKGQANYIIRGKQYTAWSVRKTYGTRDLNRLRKKEPDIQRILLHPKHRYIFLSGPNGKMRFIRKEIEKYSLPYPKR